MSEPNYDMLSGEVPDYDGQTRSLKNPFKMGKVTYLPGESFVCRKGKNTGCYDLHFLNRSDVVKDVSGYYLRDFTE